ncbi:hypothetical protein P7K49_006964 [Saguinus oedipus]|uniref:Uncharacterized protein n=1 Tax=Saguinus oedipus TaxID=9490 RepID=A0ABQ9W3Y6_SAGOE|nr:hypothetical protein P7K49_006964 [Saguinus oedipus]
MQNELVLCNYEELELSGDTAEASEIPNEETVLHLVTFAAVTPTETLTANMNSTDIAPDENQLEFILMKKLDTLQMVMLGYLMSIMAAFYTFTKE